VTAPLRHGSHVYRVQFSHDGQSVVTACADNTARVWMLQPVSCVGHCGMKGSSEAAAHEPDGVVWAAFSPNDR